MRLRDADAPLLAREGCRDGAGDSPVAASGVPSDVSAASSQPVVVPARRWNATGSHTRFKGAAP